MGSQISKEMKKILTKQGMVFKLETKVTGAVVTGKGVELSLEAAKGGNAEKLEADVVLVAIGRKPKREPACSWTPCWVSSSR